MVVEITAWHQLLLWGNLFVLLMVLVGLEGIRRERRRMERVIITMAENKKRFK